MQSPAMHRSGGAMDRDAQLRTVAAKSRSLKMLSAFNYKSIKGEAEGYLTAMLYLAPATVAGGKTVCAHSTPACRDGCLFTAGRGALPRQQNARIRRTRMFLHDRERFFDELVGEMLMLQGLADDHGMTLAIRLNGTSDILWERERLNILGETIFDLFGRARLYDYTRSPLHHRRVPANWHLTWSLADCGPEAAYAALAAGHQVAAIVPDEDRLNAPDWFMVAGRSVMVVDGEEDDLRFLDPPGALVLLRPKGRLMRGASPMVHPHLIPTLVKLGAKT